MKAAVVGGIETVVKAINTHVDNVDVCEAGCGVLLDMARDSGKNTINKNNKK